MDRILGQGNREGSESMMDLKQILKTTPDEAAAYLRQYARQILGLALFALLVHDIFGAHGFVAMRRTQKEIGQIREQIGKLNEENQSLAGQVNSLKSDPKAIERIAREDMGLARPGRNDFQASRFRQAGRSAETRRAVSGNAGILPAIFSVHQESKEPARRRRYSNFPEARATSRGT